MLQNFIAGIFKEEKFNKNTMSVAIDKIDKMKYPTIIEYGIRKLTKTWSIPL